MGSFYGQNDPLDATQGRSIDLPLPQPQLPPTPAPGTEGPAIAEETNSIVSTIRSLGQATPDNTPQTGYDPVDKIAGTKYAPYLSQFLGDVNPAQTQARMADIDHHLQNREIMANSGTMGAVAAFTSGSVEPWFFFLPEARLVEEAGILAKGAYGAATVGGATAVQQALLQSQNPVHSFGESLGNVGSNAALAGVLGAGMGWLLPGEQARTSAAFDQLKNQMNRSQTTLEGLGVRMPDAVVTPRAAPDSAFNGDVAHALGNVFSADVESIHLSQVGLRPEEVDGLIKDGLANPDGSMSREQFAGYDAERSARLAAPTAAPTAPAGGAPIPTSAGAAAADVRTMTAEPFLSSIGNYLKTIPGGEEVGNFVNRWTQRALFQIAPSTRMFKPGAEGVPETSLAGRQAMGDLVELPMYFGQEREGVAPFQGTAPVQTLAESYIRKFSDFTGAILDRGFAKYRDMEGQRFARGQAAFGDWRGSDQSGKMGFDEFQNQVHLALTENDAHAVPEVAETAKLLREHVFDPVSKFLETVKDRNGDAVLSPAREAPLGDRSFAPRFFNKAAIRRNPYGFDQMALTALKRDQAVKAGIQNRLEGLSERHGQLTKRIQWLNDRIAGKEETAADIAARGEEMTRLNKFAFERAGILREREAPIERGREGAVFETKIRGRGRELAEREQAAAGKLDAWTQELAQREGELTRTRAEIEGHISRWQGNTVAEAKAALKAREEAEAARTAATAAGTYKGKGERLTSADDAVSTAVKRILASDRDLPDQELLAKARQIRNNIDATPEGRLGYDDPNPTPGGGWGAPRMDDVRGSLNNRTLPLSTREMGEFVNHDLEHTIPSFLRNVIPDGLLTDRFGDIRMTDQLKKIDEHYDAAKAKADSAKEAQRLANMRDAEVRDLTATRDRVRGVYGLPSSDIDRNLGRVAHGIGMWNTLTMLNSSVMNRLLDVMNATSRRGVLGYMGDGFLPMMRYASGLGTDLTRANLANLKFMRIGLDARMNELAMRFGDVVNADMGGTKLERGLQVGTRLAMKANLHGPWTDLWRYVAGLAAQGEYLRVIPRMVAGNATEAEARMMAHAGIDADAANLIHSNVEAHHTLIDGVKVPNLADFDPRALEMFEGAIRKEVNTAVLMPGAEKPLSMSKPIMGLVMQFRGFEFAALQRVLIANLQQSDARALQGTLSILGMGALSYALYSAVSGVPISHRPQDWVKEAVIRSGILGPFSTFNTLQAKLTAGKTDAFRLIGADRPPTRRQQQTAVEDMLGPSYTMASGLVGATQDMLTGHTTGMDIHRLRQLAPLQNHFAFRRILDEAEDGVARHFGIKPLDRSSMAWPASPGASQPIQ